MIPPNSIRDAVADKLMGVKRYRCECCDFGTDDISKLSGINDIYDRVDVGSVMPAGECPECGAIVDGGDQDLVDAGSLHWIAAAMRRLGYTVIEPKA